MKVAERRLETGERYGARSQTRKEAVEVELDALARVAPSEDRCTAMSLLVGAWAENAPSQASAWVRRAISDSHLAAELRGEIMVVWARQDPDAAMQGLLEDADQPSDPALVALARQWAKRSPGGAEQLVELVENDSLRLQVYREIAAQSVSVSTFTSP